MADTSTIPTQGPEIEEEVTHESLYDSVSSAIQRLDMLGEQMNWLCDNLAQLFGFVSAMQQNGGGIRGAMKMLNQMPEMGTQGEAENV